MMFKFDVIPTVISIVLTQVFICWFAAQSLDDDSVGQPNVALEYCQMETMNLRCRWTSEVIVMTSARWGRMQAGRCLDLHPDMLTAMGHNPQFLGCSEDVLAMLDKKCSGRSQCDVRIPDNELDNVKPCYPDLKNYLEASYSCVKVIQESRTCQAKVFNEEQFITASLSSSGDLISNCASKSHPWRLEAPIGQRINISLLDFDMAASSRDRRDVTKTCRHQYGYIVDNKNNVSICGNNNNNNVERNRNRESHVYTSQSNGVQIVLRNGDNTNFLIRIKAIGCSNIIPPDNAWLKRSNNDILIGCYLSQQTWQLKCDGHEWKGQIGTCPDTYTGDVKDVRLTKIFEQPDSNKKLLLMVVIAGGSLIICVTVIAIGVMCLQRCKRSYKKTSVNQYDDRTQYFQNSTTSGLIQSTA